MKRIFDVVKREGRHGLDFVIESRITGEVFLVLLDNPVSDFPVFEEVKKIIEHFFEVRRWVKAGDIKFAGDQVIYVHGYC